MLLFFFAVLVVGQLKLVNPAPPKSTASQLEPRAVVCSPDLALCCGVHCESVFGTVIRVPWLPPPLFVP